MQRKSSGDLKISLEEPQGGYDPKRLSMTSRRGISAKADNRSPQATGFLTEEEIRQFQQLYKAHFGRDIDYDEAYAKGMKLIRQMELVYKPMTKEEYQQLQARRQDAERS